MGIHSLVLVYNKPIGKKMRPEDADTSVKMQVNSKGERFLVWEIL